MSEKCKHGLRVGIAHGGEKLLNACASALDGFAQVVPVVLGPLGRIESPQGVCDSTRLGTGPVDVLLVPLSVPISEGIALFAWSRAANPDVPLVLIAEKVDADLAVELVQCGAHDFVTLPLVAEALRLKLERVLGARSGPAIPSPLLEPLRFAGSRRPFTGSNRRRCFRALARSSPPATATLPGPEAEGVILLVENISIAAEGWPGGMLLSSSQPPSHLPFPEWEKGDMPLNLRIPDGKKGALAATGRLVPRSRRLDGSEVKFAVQYVMKNVEHVIRLNAYWIACQRKEAEEKGGS